MAKISISDDAYNGLRGNKAIKAADQTVFTTVADAKYMINEINHCIDDIVYFAENYFTIVSDKGKEIISLYDKQREVLEGIKDSKNSVILAARQSGKCVSNNSLIKLKNKKTNKIIEMTIGDFYKSVKK